MRKPRLWALIHWKRLVAALCALCLLGPALISLADTPFSLLYRHVHSNSSLIRQATQLNSRRVLAARDYFLHSYPGPSIRNNPLRATSSLGGPWTSRGVRGGVAKVAEGVAGGVAVGVVTIRRKQDGLGYLLQSAAALHALLSRQKPGDLMHGAALYICNVDPNPDLHADAVFLRRHLPFVERYGLASHPALNVSGLSIPGHPRRLYSEEWQDNVYDKERYDYMLCLQAALGLAPRYVLLVEDDALALPDMPRVVQHALHRMDRLQARSRHDPQTAPSKQQAAPHPDFARRNLASDRLSGDGRRSLVSRGDLAPNHSAGYHPPIPSRGNGDPTSTFVYLKLLYPLYWQGFAFELTRIVDLVSMVVVLSAIVLCALKICVRRRGFPSARAVAAVTGSCLVLCLLAGRQNVNELRRLSAHLYRLEESPHCCTPAVLYPADVIAPLVTSLAACQDRRHVDLCIQEFVKNSGLSAYILQPNLFSHVGMVTSLTMRNKPPEELLFHRNLLSDAFTLP